MEKLQRSARRDVQLQKTSIIVGICSCRKNVEQRRAIRETWMSKNAEGIQCIFFVGGQEPLEGEEDTITLPVPDGYDELPEKVTSFLLHALSKYDFEWIFKCDDDTYVALDRLAALADKKYDLIGNMATKTRGAPSGGAGYFLSRRIVQKLVSDNSMEKIGPEDIIIPNSAKTFGANVGWTSLLEQDHKIVPRRINDQVTCHWLNAKKMKAIHSVYTGEIEAQFSVVHDEWQDRLILYSTGYFARVSTSCSGKWIKKDEYLKLGWFEWGEEVVVSAGDGYMNERMLMYRMPNISSVSSRFQ